MDWTNERYVRLYTRDSTNWKRIGWDGQCVLMAILRKVDRAGTLDLSGLEPWEAIALHTGAPDDVSKRGVEGLLRTDTAVVRGGSLVLPSFIAAQECSKSDKLRSKELREKKALLGSTQSQEVTTPSRRVIPESQDVSRSSQVDDARPNSTDIVTPRHSVQGSAVPSSAVLSPPNGGGGAPNSAGSLALAPPLSAPKPKPRDEAKTLWLATLKAESEALGIARPDVSGTVRDQVIRMAREQAAISGAGFEETLRSWVTGGLRSHVDTGKPAQWAIKDWRPYAARGGPPTKPGRLPASKATTGADFEDAEDYETQMARWKNV